MFYHVFYSLILIGFAGTAVWLFFKNKQITKKYLSEKKRRQTLQHALFIKPKK